MVVAAANLDGERKDLTTLPGAFVVLKCMTWGQKLHRQQMATNQTIRSQGKGRKATTEMDIDLLARKVAEYEFAHCITEHNLEQSEGQPYDFKNPKALDSLAPRVGDEINKFISDMNNFDDEDPEEGN